MATFNEASIGVTERFWPFGLPSLPRGASIKTLLKRIEYNNRKSRSAWRRLRKAARIEISGASSAENNGSFIITGYTDASSIRIVGDRCQDKP